MKKEITSSDIARMAGVNQSTVSRALSPGRAWMISPEKREEILKLCRKYNYLPKPRHGQKIIHKTYKIGFLLGALEHDLTSAAFSFMLQELCDRLQSSNYTLTLIRVDYTSSRLSENIKRILKSDTVDIYIAGAGLLRGQTMEFMHSMSSRLICYMPFCAPDVIENRYRWISQIKYDYCEALQHLAGSIPHELLSSMLYIGSDITDQWKYAAVKKALAEHHRKNIEIERIIINPDRFLRDQSYRSAYSLLEQTYPVIKKRKLYICGSYIFAQAMTDILKKDGLIPDRDVFIITFAAFSSSADKYGPYRDEISVFGYHAEYAAEKICELALELVDDPLPETVSIPALYQPSKSFGGRRRYLSFC